MKHTITSLLLIAILASSCSATKPGYAYTIGESLNVSMWHGSYMSYGKDLFQHNMVLNGMNTISVQDGTKHTESTQWVDTTGIFYLDAARRQFVLFRGFSDTSSIIKSGPFSRKEFGFQLADTLANRPQNISSSPMRDTIVNGQRLTYDISVIESADSVAVIQYYMSNKDLTTIYDLLTRRDPGSDLHCIGMDVLVNGKPAPELRAVVSQFRPLTKEERKTCARLRKRALKEL